MHDGVDLLPAQEDNTHEQLERNGRCLNKGRQVLESVTVLSQRATGVSKCDNYCKVRQNKVFSQSLLIEVLFFSFFFFHHSYSNLNIVILAKLNRNSRMLDH